MVSRIEKIKTLTETIRIIATESCSCSGVKPGTTTYLKSGSAKIINNIETTSVSVPRAFSK
jgi:hypothetical protein